MQIICVFTFFCIALCAVVQSSKSISYGIQKLKIAEDYVHAFKTKSILCIACLHGEFITMKELKELQRTTKMTQLTEITEYKRLLQLVESGIIDSIDEDFEMINVNVAEGSCHILMDITKIENWKLLAQSGHQKFDKILDTYSYILPGTPIFGEAVKLLKNGGSIHNLYFDFCGLYSKTPKIIPEVIDNGYVRKSLRFAKTDISSKILKESKLVQDSIKKSYEWIKRASESEIKEKKKDFAEFHKFEDLHQEFVQTEGYFLFLEHVKDWYFTNNQSWNINSYTQMELDIDIKEFNRILFNRYLKWLNETFSQYEFSIHTSELGISAPGVNVTYVESKDAFKSLSIRVK